MEISELFETAKDTDKRIASINPNERIKETKGPCTIINIHSQKTAQSFKGFGGAATESAGYVLSFLDEKKQQELVNLYYGTKGGNQYSFVRTHMNSCDFSLGNWACVPEKDETLESFSMERTDKYITPLLKKIYSRLVGQGKNCGTMVSTWSPPAWMKDNNNMNFGGHLLPEYKELWAKHFLKFFDELKKRGAQIDYVSIQNEPAATQTWDSCLLTAEEEGDFATTQLGPLLEKNGYSKTKILVWDHNRDLAWERFSASMKAKNADKYIAGIAYHWYTGDQFENIKKIAKYFSSKEIVFSEGCVEGGARNGKWFTGERYAHNIINDLNSGCSLWFDWNLFLDIEGGPNHVGNNCDAPILIDTKTGEYALQSSYYYIGHFSRFIKPGATRIENSLLPCAVPSASDGQMGNTFECTSFKNPDGKIALVVCNRNEEAVSYKLECNSQQVNNAPLFCPAHAIQTILIDI